MVMDIEVMWPHTRLDRLNSIQTVSEQYNLVVFHVHLLSGNFSVREIVYNSQTGNI